MPNPIPSSNPVVDENKKITPPWLQYFQLPVYLTLIQTSTNDPTNPVSGQIWLRTDL